MKKAKHMITPNKAKEGKESEVLAENEMLRRQLAEAQETLRAIQHGEVDALIVSTPEGEQIYSITGAETNYRVLVEEMKEGAVMLSEDDRILYCNSGFAKIINQSLDTLIGKSISDTVYPNHLSSFHKLLALSRKDQGTKEKDFAFLATDGAVVPAHVSMTSLLRGNLKTTFLVITDLTQHMQQEVKQYTNDLELEIAERKKAEEELKRSEENARQSTEELQKLMDIIPAAVWLSRDPECKVIIGNQAANALYEAKGEENVSAGSSSGSARDSTRRFFRYGKELMPQELPMQEAAAKNIVIKNSEFEVVVPSGRKIAFLGNAKPLLDDAGKVRGCLAAFIDVSELKKAQEALEEYKNNLEKLVEERTKQLKDSERLAVIGATAGMVGHDIRNPLQAISGDLFLARDELKTMPAGEGKLMMEESFQEIEKNIDYINKIVADLQDYSRALKPVVKEIDLEDLCNDVLFKNSVPKNIAANCTIDSQAKTIMSDPDLLKRILSNLVSNAIHASPNGGRLAIHASIEAGELVVTVQDAGVGIPDDVKSKLFTPLFTTRAKGQGFGLAVVKRMTETLGGKVTFESQVGKGTTFIVRLPPPKELNGKWTYK